MNTDNTNIAVVAPVSDQYAATFQPTQIESLGSAGGFSGARFWRLQTPAGVLCLRCWPPERPSRERLEWIHTILRHTANKGLSVVPAPIPTRSEHTFVSHNGRFWELTAWLPGAADFHQQPRRAKLSAAMTALAELHAAACSVPGVEPKCGCSPGIKARLEYLRSLRNHGSAKIARAVRAAGSDWPELADRAGRLLTGFQSTADKVEHELDIAQTASVPLQICIRDIWHDHVLFQGDEVSGIVDFGAMRVESVAGDVARLLGSLVRDDEEAWQIGLNAYQRVRPRSPAEVQLIPVFDHSSVLMSGMNWLTWIYLEGRRFDDRATILERLDQNLERLQRLGG